MADKRISKNKVLEWINDNFDTSELTLIDFPALPGGTRVVDKELNEMFVYYDILNDQVRFNYPVKDRVV